jgi:hypothetical protein
MARLRVLNSPTTHSPVVLSLSAVLMVNRQLNEYALDSLVVDVESDSCSYYVDTGSYVDMDTYSRCQCDAFFEAVVC